MNREKRDTSKTQDFLPSDKQYLVTCGIHCLHCATSLAYTDADEDAKHLLSFTNSSALSTDGDEWVKTHMGRQAHKTDSVTNAGEIADIPDLDGDEERIVKGLGGIVVGWCRRRRWGSWDDKDAWLGWYPQYGGG